MALNAYLMIEAEATGKIEGSCTQAGREGSLEVYGGNHEIISPRDSASGMATGKRQHKPLSLTASVDKATPLLYHVLVNNETITKFELRFWRPSRSGAEVQFYTIELLEASVSAIRAEMLNNKYPENMRLPELITYDFSYQKIIWTWEDGGITAMDDWETPVV